MRNNLILILVIVVLFSITYVSALTNSINLNIQCENSGVVCTGSYSYKFDLSTNTDCSSPDYTTTKSITTDARGIFSTTLTNVNLDFVNNNYRLCVYRDLVLKSNLTISTVPYSYYAQNTSWVGVSGRPTALSNFTNDIGVNASFNQSLTDTLYLAQTDQRYNETGIINSMNASWLSTYNITYNQILNQTCPSGNYTYAIQSNGTILCRSDNDSSTSLTNVAYLNNTQTFTVNQTVNANFTVTQTIFANLFSGSLSWSNLINIPNIIYGLWTSQNPNNLLISNGTAVGYNQSVFNTSVDNRIALNPQGFLTTESDPLWSANKTLVLYISDLPLENRTRVNINNVTGFAYNYNQSDGSYNVTYATYAYNQTIIQTVSGVAPYINASVSSGVASIQLNETKLNQTISDLGVRVGFNSTYNSTYDAKISFNNTNVAYLNNTQTFTGFNTFTGWNSTALTQITMNTLGTMFQLNYDFLGSLIPLFRFDTSQGFIILQSMTNLPFVLCNDDCTAQNNFNEDGSIVMKTIRSFSVQNATTDSFYSNATYGLLRNTEKIDVITKNVNATNVNITSNKQSYNFTSTFALDTTFNNSMERPFDIRVSVECSIASTDIAYATLYVNGSQKAYSCLDTRNILTDIGGWVMRDTLIATVQPGQKYSVNTTLTGTGSVTKLAAWIEMR